MYSNDMIHWVHLKCILTPISLPYMIVQGRDNVKSLATLGTPKCMMTSITFPYMIVQGSVNVKSIVTLGTPK